VTRTEDASLRTVVVAVAANLLVAVAKAVAALLTGSAAMLAETTHSVADTLNEALLWVGVRRGARPADERHPFGYGQARYTWSLLAAVGIFVVGGVFAIADGIQGAITARQRRSHRVRATGAPGRRSGRPGPGTSR
jgi:cation diffusion facilitator family transporter